MNRIFLSLLILLAAAPAHSQTIRNKLEKCNVYYNNMGRVFSETPCRVWFDSTGRLYRSKVFLPNGNRWYDWDASTQRGWVSQDQRWRECIRYTMTQGQYQVCTVKSPQEFGF